MAIITPPTQAERIRAIKLSMVERAAESANNAIVTLANIHAGLWSLPTDELLAILNADPAETQAMLTGHLQLGTQLNASQDSAATTVINPDGSPRYTARVPLGLGRADIVPDPVTGLWVYVPPVVEEPSAPEP